MGEQLRSPLDLSARLTILSPPPGHPLRCPAYSGRLVVSTCSFVVEVDEKEENSH